MPLCSRSKYRSPRCREWVGFIRDAFAKGAVANNAGSPKGKSIRDLGSRMTLPVRDGLPIAGSRRRLLGQITYR